jgi:hypothetical protein
VLSAAVVAGAMLVCAVPLERLHPASMAAEKSSAHTKRQVAAILAARLRTVSPF